MNKPNEELLTNWLEGKLDGDEQRQMEAWAEEHAGDLDREFKCDIGWQVLNDELLASVPQTEEPPYPEFFNSKLEQAILANATEKEEFADDKEGAESLPVGGSLWQKIGLIVMPAAVAAAVAFYAGTQMKEGDRNANGVLVERENVIYIPDENVQAEVSDSNVATEIVLDGLSPISDDFNIDFSSISQDGASMMATHKDDSSEVFY